MPRRRNAPQAQMDGISRDLGVWLLSREDLRGFTRSLSGQECRRWSFTYGNLGVFGVIYASAFALSPKGE